MYLQAFLVYDTQHNDIQHYDTQHKGLFLTLSINDTLKNRKTEKQHCVVVPNVIMLSGIVLSGIVLSGIVLSGIVLSGIKLSGIMLSGIMLSGIMLSGIMLSGIVLSGIMLSGIALTVSTREVTFFRRKNALAYFSPVPATKNKGVNCMVGTEVFLKARRNIFLLFILKS